MQPIYQNRRDAGRVLTSAMEHFKGRNDLLVLALPRGGVPVAFEIADAFGAALDLLIVRKLGVPGHEELAMGAIASGGARVLNEQVIGPMNISPEALQRVEQAEREELVRRERAYRGERPPAEVAGRCAILVDDGLATGASMFAAVAAVRQLKPAELVVAVPVAPPSTVQSLKELVDEVVCPSQPEPFYGVGAWYQDFAQTSDDEVRHLLDLAWDPQAHGASR